MLVLILIVVQYSEKAVFGFEKGWNCRNHSTSGSNHPVKNSPPAKFPILPLPHPLSPYGKPWIAIFGLSFMDVICVSSLRLKSCLIVWQIVWLKSYNHKFYTVLPKNSIFLYLNFFKFYTNPTLCIYLLQICEEQLVRFQSLILFSSSNRE